MKSFIQETFLATNFRVYPNGTLSISAATADNEGNYLCKADNGVGEAISKLAHVGINGEWNMDGMTPIFLEGGKDAKKGGIISESRKGNYAASNADVLQMRAEGKLRPLRLPLTPSSVPNSRYIVLVPFGRLDRVVPPCD